MHTNSRLMIWREFEHEIATKQTNRKKKLFYEKPTKGKAFFCFHRDCRRVLRVYDVMLWFSTTKSHLMCMSECVVMQTRASYSCIAERNDGKNWEKRYRISTLSYFNISLVPVDLMFITMSWIFFLFFFHYKTLRKRPRKGSQKKKKISKIFLANERNKRNWT